ncbi:MAG: dienelactone hydrolase family protein [Alphaproteobacteria bacterium]
MSLRPAIVLAALLGLARSVAAVAAPPVAPSELVVERTLLTVDAGDGAVSLETLILRPPGPGPFPLAVIAHGGTTRPEDRARLSLDTYRAPAEEFARRGYATLFALRSGYGQSKGSFGEFFGRCAPGRPDAIGRTIARAIRGIVEAGRKLPYVDPNRVVVIGHSMGGLGAVSMTDEPDLAAVINFAGGFAYFSPDCDPSLVAKAFGAFGAAGRAPALFVYSENDALFGPAVAKSFFNAYTGAGGRGEFVAAPAYANNGHGLFRLAAQKWRPAVDDFLRKNGLPTWDSPPED